MLASEDGLANEIRWVHAGEVPNIAAMLKGGELLLSTGMGLGTTSQAQRRFATELADRRIAALAIELGTALRAVPPTLIDAAEKEGLCLIALHREVRFVEVSEVVHRRLIDQGGEMLRQGETLHKRFTNLMLGGARVPEILSELSRFIRNPVILERNGRGIAYHVCHQADDTTVLGAWGSYSRNLAAAPRALSERVPMGEGDSWGRLVALAIDSPLEPHDQVALERAVGLIALSMMRETEEEGLAARRRGDFLAGLATSRAGSREIANRAAELGFVARGKALLPVAVGPPRSTEDRSDAGWTTLRLDVKEELALQAVPILTGAGERDESLMLIGLTSADDRPRIADLLVEVIERAAARRLGEERPIICVGAACTDWLQVGEGFVDAAEALAAAWALEPRPWHDAAAVSVDRLLHALRDRQELQQFTMRRLRPLIELDQHSRGDLIRTLTAYCDHAGHKAATSESLSVKRQTLYHRLRRIETALDADLDDGETRLSLHLALRSSRYLDLQSHQ